MKKKINNLIIIVTLFIIFIILILVYIKIYKTDTFININNALTTNSLTTNPFTTKQQPIDRTKLYGSLSLEPKYFQSSDNILKTMNNKVDNTIIDMTNPSIKYEDSRLQLNSYSDILL